MAEEPINIKKQSIKIVIIYTSAGIIWLLASNRLISTIAPSRETLHIMHTYKSWFYLIATAILLFLLINYYTNKIQRNNMKLKKSEDKFRYLVENVTDWLWKMEENGEIRYSSPMSDSLLGYKPSEMMGKVIFDLMEENDARIFRDKLMQKIKNHESFKSWPHQIKHEDGHKVYFETSGSPEYNDDGEFLGAYCCVSRDITDQINALDALKESEGLFRAVTETTASTIFIIQDNKFVYGNTASEQITGFSRAELFKMNFLDIVHPDFRELVKERAMARLEKRWVPPQYELKIITKSGEVKWLEFNGGYIDFRGKPAILGSAFDITAKKQADEAVAIEKNTAQKYLDVVNTLLVILDKDQHVTLINKKGSEMLGYEERDIIGKNWFDNFVPEGERARVRAGFDQLIKGDIAPVEYFENPILTSEEKERTVAFHNSYITDEQGNITATISSGEDITDRLEAKKALLESEDKLKSIIEYSVNLFYKHDTNHVLTYMSPQTEQFFDCSPEEAMVKWTEFATDNPINKSGYESTQRAIDTGETQPPFELELIGKKGRKLWVLANEAPIVKNDKTEAIVGALTDITDRKRAEEALKESEEKYRGLVEQSIVGVSIVQDGKLIYSNPKLAEMFGYSADEMVFFPAVERLVFPEDRELVQDKLTERLTGRTLIAHYVFRGIKKDGSIIDVEVHGTRMIYRHKPAIIATLLDITERKRSIEALRESEELYKKLIGSANDAIILANAETGIIIEVNEAAEKMMGFPRNDLIGKNHLELHPKEEAERYAKLFKERRGVYTDLYVVDKDTRRIPVEISSSIMETDGKKFQQGIFRDITERKQSEEALRKKDADIRRAYADVFGAVTGGRLIIMSSEEILAALGDPSTDSFEIMTKENLSEARSVIRSALEGYFDKERISDITVAASEGMTNTVKHAGKGNFRIYRSGKTFQILISDSGPGIDFTILPKATLLSGFSTKQSLGMGFSFMLEFCDRLLLSTKPGETDIVLEINAK